MRITGHARNLPLLAWLLCWCAGLIPGCRTSRHDLLASGTFALERVPDERGYYRDVHAYEEDNAVRVIGYVRRFLEPGHVHLQLIDSDGAVVFDERTLVNRPLRSSRVRHARFEARLPVPPGGGPITIRIVHHRNPHDDQQG